MTKQTGPGRPRHDEPLNSAHFKIGASDREKLNLLAEHREKSRSEVIRDLIQEAQLAPSEQKPDLVLPALQAFEISSQDPFRAVLVNHNENRSRKYLVMTLLVEANEFGTWDWIAEIDAGPSRSFVSRHALAEWVSGFDSAVAMGAMS